MDRFVEKPTIVSTSLIVLYLPSLIEIIFSNKLYKTRKYYIFKIKIKLFRQIKKNILRNTNTMVFFTG